MPQPPNGFLCPDQCDTAEPNASTACGDIVFAHVPEIDKSHYDPGESEQTLDFGPGSKVALDIIDNCDPETETSNLQGTFPDVSNVWLDEEMKAYIQSIDARLERLFSLLISRHHSEETIRPSGKMQLHSEESMSKTSRSTCAELSELKKMDAAGDMIVIKRQNVKRSTNRIPPTAILWRSKSRVVSSESLAAPPPPSKTFESRGTDQIREIIASYTDGRTGLRFTAWRFLEDPHSSPWARAYALFMTLFTVLGVFVTFWQSVQGCPLRPHANMINMAIEIVFTTEIVVRFIASPDRKAFWHNLYNYIDLISSLPLLFRCVTMFQVVAGQDNNAEGVLSKIAIVPVLRLFRLMRHFESAQLLPSAFLVASEVLPILLYTLSIIAMVFSALIRLVEPSEIIPDLPSALWFVMVTITTVGYGDVSPETGMGKAITAALMVISVLYMAIPIGIVGNAFSQVWEARDRLLLMRRMREAFAHRGFNAETLRGIVAQFDLDEDGVFSLDEFKSMLKALRIKMSDERIALLMDSMDEDGRGSVDLDELVRGLFPCNFRGLLDSLALRDSVTRRTASPAGSTAGQRSGTGLRSVESAASKGCRSSTGQTSSVSTFAITATSQSIPSGSQLSLAPKQTRPSPSNPECSAMTGAKTPVTPRPSIPTFALGANS